ncbi:MAG: hypothetical protein J7L23_01810 [Candidatus Diapherotrites archaeon]|nr:hypothetical protein [Candidatus Diapherotrites archaeon]
MYEMSGILKEGRDGGYIIRAFDTPVIILDKHHDPTQQYLRAFGKEKLGKKVEVMIVDQHENYWMAQISPEELKAKGFSRAQERKMGR